MKETVASKFAYAAALFFILGMFVVIGLGVQNEFESSPPPRVIAYVLQDWHFTLHCCP